MKMITTKEASKRWGISPRRITMLASEGRIPGARFEWNHWLIPDNADKPSDRRRKGDDPRTEEKYIFPNIPYCICYKHPAKELDGEERQLYKAYMQYESGDFAGGEKAASDLLGKTENIYVKIGAAYVLIFFSIILHKHEQAAHVITLFRDLCDKISEQSPMVFLMKREEEILFGSRDWIIHSFSVFDYDFSTPFEMAYAAYFSIIKAIFSDRVQPGTLDADLHELTVKRLEDEGFCCIAMYYHAFLSSLYASDGNSDLESMHLKRAFDIAVEQRLFTSMASLSFYIPDLSLKIINEYPEEIRAKFADLIEQSTITYSEFYAYYENATLLSVLSVHDRCLISYCLRNYPLKQIAEIEDVSLSTIKRQLLTIYKKFGVETKTDLVKTYNAMIMKTGEHAPTPV